MKEKLIIWFFIGLAIFFYIVTWSVREYGDTAWYIGIGLPWLSLILCVPISLISGIIFHIELFDKIEWGLSYALCSILYVIVMTVMTKNLFPFIPHLAACACFIAACYVEALYNESEERRKKIKESVDFLESKLESIDKLVIQINENNNDKYRDRLTELLLVQISEGYRTLSKISVVAE